jgi:signal transduction histidine kinase
LHDESILPSERALAISQLEELHRLTRIVEGLTFLSKADAGQITQEWDTLHLDELVKEAYADAQILAEPQNLRVELAFCEEVKIHGDRHRVRQLLLNLVDNAIKYNQPKGFVRMSLCCNKKNEAEFVIKNPGIGIDPEKLPRVFDRFFRGDPAHSQAVEGCGLGLSIAQHIVSAHGGTIKIESVPNQITTVTVCFTLNSKTKPT